MKTHSKKKTNQKATKENPGNNGKRTYIGVSIDEQLWKRLRALAIKQDINSGPLLDRAIEEYLLMNE